MDQKGHKMDQKGHNVDQKNLFLRNFWNIWKIRTVLKPSRKLESICKNPDRFESIETV